MKSNHYPDQIIHRELRSLVSTTKPWEVVWLLWKAAQVPGNILEIGCRFGETTFEFASEFPNRTVFAVDCLDEGVIQPWQKHERPTRETVCERARHLPNVRLALQDSKQFSYEGKQIGFVFIDGDHSFTGVKADTELALAAKVKTIVWHDYYLDSVIAVKPYLDQLDLQMSCKVTLVNGTCLAFLDL